MPTLCSQKAVIEIEPTNYCSNIESTTNWIELIVSPWHAGSYICVISNTVV